MKLFRLFVPSVLLISVILFSTGNCFAQIFNDAHLEIEGGFTYNQLNLHTDQYEFSNGSNTSITIPAKDENRTHFQLLPAVQLGLDVHLPFVKLLSVEPFIGYNQTGGESDTKPNGYQDRILFRTFSPGLYVNVNLRHYVLGAGVRYDTYLTRYSYSHGTLLSNSNQNAHWERNSINFLINKHSWMAGAKIKRTIWRNIGLQVSGWYGLTDIASRQVYLDTIKTVQFRLMVCYRL